MYTQNLENKYTYSYVEIYAVTVLNGFRIILKKYLNHHIVISIKRTTMLFTPIIIIFSLNLESIRSTPNEN